jgi:tetratricopeptide (TPR) repeat protein
MRTAHKTHFFLFVILLWGLLGICTAQVHILNNREIMNPTREVVENLYNYNFARAESLLPALERKTTGHPLVPLLKALIIYQRDYPLMTSSPTAGEFERLCNESITLAEAFQKENSKDTEGAAFNMLSRALLSMYYVDNGESMAAAKGAVTLYRQIAMGFDKLDEFNEFYFTTGLYNYYRIAYPEAHPVYKPIAALFPQGNKVTGLQQLLYASENCIFLKAESLLFLSLIYNNYEKSPMMAMIHAQKLHALFPENLYFRSEFTEALLINQQYQSAREQTEVLLRDPGKAYVYLRGITFRGILYDRLDNNQEAARTDLEAALRMAPRFGKYGDVIQSIAHFSLSRIYRRAGETKIAESHYKAASSKAIYPWEYTFAR